MDSQVPFFSIMVARISCWFLVLMLILPNRLQSETTSEIFTFSRTPHVSTDLVLVMEMMIMMMMMMMVMMMLMMMMLMVMVKVVVVVVMIMEMTIEDGP